MKRAKTAWRFGLIGLSLALLTLVGIIPNATLVDRALSAAHQAQADGYPMVAVEIAARTAGRFPDRADLWEKAGRYALQAGDPRVAKQFFQRALSAGSLSPQGFVEMGDAAFAERDLPAAISAWEALILSGSSNIDVYLRLLKAHRLQGDLAAQITDLQSLAQLDPSNAQFHYQLGLLLAAQMPDTALPPLMRAAALEASLAPAARTIQTAINTASLENDAGYLLLSSGRALASLGEWQLAKEAFSQAVQLNPGFADAWAYLGEAHFKLGQDGQIELEKALELDPNSVAANTLLGLFWRGKGDYSQSLIYLDQAAGLDPGNPALQAELGSAYADLGNLSAALEHFQIAAQLAPGDSLYWRLLAQFSLDYAQDVRQIGLPAARQAVVLAPHDPVALDVLAQVYILLDSPLMAQRFLSRALQADPGFAPARLHQGVLYLALGNIAEAQKQLSLALALAGDNPATAEQAQRLLETFSP